MGKVNYDDISNIYDDVREEELDLVKRILDDAKIEKGMNVLDVGCGTGNYANVIQKITKANIFGVDSSSGMLEKAKEKNKNVIFKIGSIPNLPFEDESFDFIYMTDVIHHIDDIDKMFLEFNRILKNEGKICISTQSHRQIDLRYMSEFFPETAIVDKKRYPDIDKIKISSEKNAFDYIKSDILGEGDEVILDAKYIETIEKKGFSMLHLISEDNYEKGLKNIKRLIDEKNIIRKSAGTTLVWLKK